MNWLYPAMLWGLAMITVPVIIHFFYFRRYKKVDFPDIRFLKEVKNETNKFSKVKNLLALLMRVLVIAALVFAFAQPFLSGDKKNVGQNNVSIYIDNSQSMLAEEGDIPLLEIAKKKSREIVEAYSEQDMFQVVTNELRGTQQFSVDKSSALEAIRSIELYKGHTSKKTVYSRQKEFIETNNSTGEIYWISDFQKADTDLDFQALDSTVIKVVPVQAGISKNVSLDSAWFLRPNHKINESSDLVIKISNRSNIEAPAVAYSMEYLGQSRPLGNINLEQNASFLDTVSVPITKSGWQSIHLSIADYPISFDDHLYLSFYTKPSYKVLVINQKNNPYLKRLFPSQSYIDIEQQNAQSLNYSSFETADLIILEDLISYSTGLKEQIKSKLENGGKVLAFPSAKSGGQSINQILTEIKGPKLVDWQEGTYEVFDFDNRSTLFKDVFKSKSKNLNLPTSLGRYTLSKNARHRSLMTYRDGKSFLVEHDYGSGLFLTSSSPFEASYSDFYRQGEILVPMLYNLIVKGQDEVPAYYLLGQEAEFSYFDKTQNSDAAFSWRKEDMEIIAPQRRFGRKLVMALGRHFPDEGSYQLYKANLKLGPIVSMNQSRLESDPNCFTKEELNNKWEDNIEILQGDKNFNLTAEIGNRDSASWLWKYLLMGVLGFLLLESLVLRWPK